MPNARPIASLLASFLISICLGATAQTLPADNKASPAPVTAAPAERSTDRRIEHIQHEDAGSRIDELRVGGETQSITVSPKGGMPPYEVIPATGNRSPATAERGNTGASGGTRVWKVLDF